MGNAVEQYDVGDSIPFEFDRDGESLEGWVCTINVKVYPGDSNLVDRVISATGDTWEGFRTATETLGFGAGDYRLIATFIKASTDEQESSSKDKRFRLSEAY